MSVFYSSSPKFNVRCSTNMFGIVPQLLRYDRRISGSSSKFSQIMTPQNLLLNPIFPSTGTTGCPNKSQTSETQTPSPDLKNVKPRARTSMMGKFQDSRRFAQASPAQVCSIPGRKHKEVTWNLAQRVQSTFMVQNMVSVVVISLMVWMSISPYGYLGPFG